MAPVDILIILAFIVYAIFSGFRNKSVASKNLEEYFLAGRSLSGWKAGISMAATQFASDTPLLVTGLIAMSGLFALWRLWIYALAFLLMGFLLAPSWRRSKVLTDAELTELRYSGPPALGLRIFKAIYFGTVFNCVVLAMVLLAATRIAEPFLFWDKWLPSPLFTPFLSFVRWVDVPLTLAPRSSEVVWILSTNNFISILIVAFVTVFYSTTGGLRSVVNTDLLQFALAMGGTAFFAVTVVNSVGGFEEMKNLIFHNFSQGGPGGITPSQIYAITPSQAKDVSFVLLSVFALQWIVQINADGTGYLAQRMMACRNDHEAKKAAVVFTFAQIFFRSLLWIPIGLGLLVLFPPDLSLPVEVLRAEREATYVIGMAKLLPPGLKGLMLTGMLAALASTLDTHLNWGSSYWTNDIYKRLICGVILKKEPTGSQLVWVARLSNVFILLLALVIMTKLPSIRTAWETSLLLGSGVGIMLVLRWVWWRITAWGELASVLTSLILAPILLTKIPSSNEALRLLLMAVGATTVGVLVSLWKGAEKKETLQKFYNQVQPPGFWAPIAKSGGLDIKESRLKLYRGLSAMGLTAVSLFCLLTGFGSWMVGSPSPTWFPARSVWIALLFFVGLGLIPVWWKLGFSLPKNSK